LIGVDQKGRFFEIFSALRPNNTWCSRTFGELQSPVGSVLGIDFKEPSALIAPREAILNPEYCEGFVTGAHEHLAVPGAAANIVHSIEIVKALLQVPLIENSTVAGRRLPPALAHPAAFGAVSQRNGNQIGGLVTDAQFGMGWCGKCQEAAKRGGHQGKAWAQRKHERAAFHWKIAFRLKRSGRQGQWLRGRFDGIANGRAAMRRGYGG